jgi:thiol-disulfide isomerase/thioredoxin
MLLSLYANATVIDLKTADQVKTELAKPGPRVLMYYTDWCPSCHEFMPTYKKLSNSMTNIKFYTMNLDKLALKEHAGKVPYIPTMFVGKSDSDLRNNPCTDLNNVERTIPILKKTIEGCLNK